MIPMITGITLTNQSSGRFSGPGLETHLHRQRHWTPAEVIEALEASGLRCLAALGQREESSRVLLSDSPDEERDAKIIYIAAHTSANAQTFPTSSSEM